VSNTAYGAQAERRVRDYYAGRGYNVVRAAGSQGPADLVAFRLTYGSVIELKAIQVKATRHSDYVGRMETSAYNDLLKLGERMAHLNGEIWVWDGERQVFLVTNLDTAKTEVIPWPFPDK